MRVLRDNPEGYFWPLEYIRRFVADAEVIVRARAVDVRLSERPNLAGKSLMRFEVLEEVKGRLPGWTIEIAGVAVDHDDFNPKPVPYRIVRPGGQRGDCYATGYRLGAEYLLLLKSEGESLEPYWAGLAPLNEQIRGPGDPWMNWVREEVSAIQK